MAHVFFSYVRENQADVERLCESLRNSGVQVWLDREQIKPGQRWQRVIREAIRSGAYFIACFSQEYRERDETYMHEELLVAIKELRKKPAERTWFIPVLLSECELPDHEIGAGETLRDIQWVSLKSDWDTGLANLLHALDVELGDPEKPVKHTGNKLLDAAWNAYINASDDRALYCLEEAAALGHPAVKEELLRIPVCQHSLAVAKLQPFPEYVPIAIRAITTTYDQSNMSASDFLYAAVRSIANEIMEEHLVPVVATATYFAEITNGGIYEGFDTLVWFVSNLGQKEVRLKPACLHILHRIGELELEDDYRNELDKAVECLTTNHAN